MRGVLCRGDLFPLVAVAENVADAEAAQATQAFARRGWCDGLYGVMDCIWAEGQASLLVLRKDSLGGVTVRVLQRVGRISLRVRRCQPGHTWKPSCHKGWLTHLPHTTDA